MGGGWGASSKSKAKVPKRKISRETSQTQVELPGTRFVDFWSQRQKVIKSSFLGLIFSTFGANQRQKVFKSSFLGSVLSTSGAKARKSFKSKFVGLVLSASEAGPVGGWGEGGPEVEKTNPRKSL